MFYFIIFDTQTFISFRINLAIRFCIHYTTASISIFVFSKSCTFIIVDLYISATAYFIKIIIITKTFTIICTVTITIVMSSKSIIFYTYTNSKVINYLINLYI